MSDEYKREVVEGSSTDFQIGQLVQQGTQTAQPAQVQTQMPAPQIQAPQDEALKVAKKQLAWTKVIAGIAIAALIALIVSLGLIVPKTVKLIDLANQEIVQAADVFEDAEEALENVNKIDFDALSESISHLSNVINGIANIFK